MTAARTKAMIMPFWPPNARPMNIRSSVSSVSKNAVLKVFPIEVARLLDGTPGGGIQGRRGEFLRVEWRRLGHEAKSLKEPLGANMSKKDLALIASRFFALLMSVWALMEISYLPEHLFAFRHYVSQRSVLSSQDYYTSLHFLVVISCILRITALLVLAILFWKPKAWLESILFSNDRVVSD